MKTPRRAAGFTLIELLVAILIIVLLISITIPVVSRVRQAAYATNSAAMIQALDGAIRQYQQMYQAYPGPLTPDQLGFNPPTVVINQITGITAGQITGSENLLLGLMGGLRYDAAATPSMIFDWQIVGTGPRSLSPRVPQRKDPFMESKDLSWTDSQPSSGSATDKNVPDAASGFFADDATPARSTGAGVVDSPIPEFVDRFPNPMPILYLRARIGAPGIVGIRGVTWPPAVPQQYDLIDILAYTDPDGQYDNAIPPAAGSIGVKKSLENYYNGTSTPIANVIPYHGLRSVNANRQMMHPDQANYFMPADAFDYFKNPSLSNPGPNGTWGDADDVLVPRQKDAYILICAGKDRVYGTDDDITNFGPVIPTK